MINRIVRGNLFHRKTRTLMTILAISVEVAMILLILGLSDGLIEESAQRKKSIAADIIIRPSASDSSFTTGTNGLPMALVGQIAATPGVAAVAGTTISLPSDLQTITGVDWAEFEHMAGAVKFLEGGSFQDPDSVIVDNIYARQKHVKIGDTLQKLNHDFHVVGIIETGKMSRIFIPRDTMQRLMGWQNEVSQIYVRLQDPSQTDAMIAQLEKVLPDHPIRRMDEFITMFAAQTRDMASSFVDAIMGIAVVVGFLVVLLSMYTAVLDRTRDIGILKSLGASRAYIVSIFVRETLWLTVAGIALGCLISSLATHAVERLFPLVTILTLNSHLVWAFTVSVLASIAGALYPAIQAASKDPISALSYD